MLTLDRPFSYELAEELGAGVGSLVQVPFHGKLVRGWVLGPTDDVPGRILPVRKVVSPVRFFDPPMLELLRWVSERYVAPLASVIARSHPPRVASEEGTARPAGIDPVAGSPRPAAAPAIASHRGGEDLLRALTGREARAFILRPRPEDEQEVAVEAVAAALARGRTAIVLVPEAAPLPATARAVADAFGDAAMLVGGSRRSRFRTWLDVQAGRHRVVVGTRPAVFAPVADLGLVYVSRESHGGHREERSPYYHVRDVALARARLSGATCVMAALCPSAEAVATGAPEVIPAGRWWAPVEVVPPGPEGRAPRLVSALKSVTRAFLYAPVPGYGVARVCRTCGEPAACAACGGMLRAEGGAVRCIVCGADGLCASCGGSDFGIVKGGAERVEEWARRVAPVPVRRLGPGDRPVRPGRREVLVGGPEAVKDFGPAALDLVAILDADVASRRPGLASGERALATWMEAAAWARPPGRVIVQARRPGDPAVQALVSGNPARFHRVELPRRADAGFPAGWPVFRVAGTARLPAELEAMEPRTLLVSGADDETICLLALDPRVIPSFGRRVRALAEQGVVTRVEAEPHL